MQTTNSRVVRTEFAAAITQIANERKISTDSIYTAIKQALVSAYRKQYGDLEEDAYYFVELNEDNGESRIFKAPATKVDEETGEVLEWDESKSKDVTPAGFGRIAAQTAKQVILQKIRESEKDQIISEYEDRIGEIITAQILRMDGRKVVLDLGRGQGIMPPEEQMRGEFYKVNSRITVLIKEIRETHRGQTIIASRADKDLVVKLFEREVPEVQTGAVEIALIAREAGVRTKLAVRSTQDGVDPVGSCVGQRGVRVQEVIRELNNEKLDIIPWSDNSRLLLQGALAPAEGLKIDINEEARTVEVTAPDDQLSLAIGRGGQNVRLAAKLTNYKITIKSADGTVESAVTGEEEYEIDTFDGLSEEARTFLVDNKLTTLGDLVRFKNKWVESEDLEEDQRGILMKLVEEFEARDEEVSLLKRDNQ
ncbi:MAG: transcription termination/antitermination protein NusA [Pseudomonadales bacterium]|nr:transcription termination/antitermination protein NusA [Candidatus Woesebacteria bacterium]MCB9801043.1 transcription termination/antitermination protein NusA [Pseudomonadales bacterium]